MSANTLGAAAPARSRRGFMALFAVLAAMTFSASGAAPTPLYHLYQDQFGLSALTITIIFASYVFALLAALLTVGGLSDYVGRKPVILAMLLLNLAAMALFAEAGSAGTLIAARVVQGFANGGAMTVMGATILDSAPRRGPVLNSITAFLGLSAGSLGAGVLVAFGPAPTHLIYIVLGLITALGLAALPWLPETGARRPGAMASLRPYVSVPAAAVTPLLALTPVNVAAWAFGGFYFSLMPSLVRVTTGLQSPFVGGAIVAAMTFCGMLGVLASLKAAPVKALELGSLGVAAGVALVLAGVQAHNILPMLIGSATAGAGFGSVFSGALRTLLPLAAPEARAGLLAAFFVESYLAFSLPAIGAGLIAPRLGLQTTVTAYGAVLIALTLLSMVLARRPAQRPFAGA